MSKNKKDKDKKLWKYYSFCYDSLLQFSPYRSLLDLVIHTASFKYGESVADIGSGTSNLEWVSNTRGVKFYCLDFSDDMFKIGKKKFPDAEYIKYNANTDNLPVDKGSLDKVVSINFVYTVKNPEALFIDVNESLKVGGFFIFTTSIKKGLWPLIKEYFKKTTLFGYLKTIIFLPIWMFVFLINVIIDNKFESNFHEEKKIEELLVKNNFIILKKQLCYGGLNTLIVARKV